MAGDRVRPCHLLKGPTGRFVGHFPLPPHRSVDLADISNPMLGGLGGWGWGALPPNGKNKTRGPRAVTNLLALYFGRL